MKIKMILGQICKNRHIKIYSMNSVVIQGMTGNFNYCVFSPRSTSFRKEFIENKGVWTGHLMSIFCPNAIDSKVHRRKHAHLLSSSLESTSDDIGGGRLPLGSGNSYYYHILCRISVIQIGQNPAKIVIKHSNRAIKSDSIFEKMKHTN
jgi:hypothetical protein